MLMESGVESVSGDFTPLMLMSFVTHLVMMDHVRESYTVCLLLFCCFLLDPIYYYNGYQLFGYNTGPIVWSYLYCQGWEKDLFECSKSIYTQFSCPARYLASVTCKEGKPQLHAKNVLHAWLYFLSTSMH